MQTNRHAGVERPRRPPVRIRAGRIAIVIAATWLSAQPAASRGAESDWRDRVSLTLSDRVRGEFVDWFESTADHDAHRYDFFANQFRIGAKITAPMATFVAEMQDTRLVNLPNDASLKAPAGGSLGPGAVYYANTHDRDQGEPFLKQAYMTVKGPGELGSLAFTGGRFEYSDGLETMPTDAALAWLKRQRIGERLVGPFGYTHVTRSIDGIKLAYDTPDFNVTAFGSRPTHGGFEISANRELDIWLTGIAATLKQLPGMAPLDARLFYLYYEDERGNTNKTDNRGALAPAQDDDPVTVHTWGAHAATVVDVGPGRWDGLLWGALQAGDWGDFDHFGWSYAVETGYQFPKIFAAPWLRTGYNRSSGDDDPNDKDHHTFFQLLPTARIYAQMPFFNLMNTGDLFAQLILKPHSKVMVRTDYHWLQLTESKDLWYSGGGATNNDSFGYAGLSAHGNRDLAHLVDLAVTVSLTQQLTAYGYYGHAFGQDVADKDFAGSSANYGYIELTFKY